LIDNNGYFQIVTEFMDLSVEPKKYTDLTTSSQRGLSHWHKVAVSVRHSPDSGLNPLADQAASIFGHIHLMAHGPLSSETKRNITEHLEILQTHYQKLDYSPDISLAAHYIVCATLDDILRCIGSSDGQFLQKFHNSRIEQEKFYSILEHISPQADKYIDLLELMYLCLRFGYKGQYRNTPFGLQQWSFITDNVYRVIAQTRGQHSHTLSPSLFPLPSTDTSVSPGTISAGVTKKRRKFYTITLLAFAFLAIITGFIFRQTYDTTREALMTHEFVTSQQDQEATP
jgi:type IV/VI secretion system ImpK/VasF family protein